MFHQRMVLLTLAVAFLGYAAAKPTTLLTIDDSLVISTDSNNEVTTDSYTTDEPNAPIKLTEMDVLSTISLRYAHTAVVTSVRNPARFAQESTFRMLLPDTAFISGFTMTVDGKPYKAFIKKKEEAKQIYSKAVSQGFGAAHIAAKARDSNHFTVSMNVEPRSTVVFNLTYEELLVRRNGVYNHAINLHPGALVPKMKVTVHIKEAGTISTVRVPEIRTGNEIDADENAPQNGNVIINRTEDDREAIITFTPDADEQKRLIRVYNQRSGSRGRSNEGMLGQFVVQYDVDHSSSGEILVNDGYFVHFFAPTSLSPLPKHVVFVLDTSISMSGREIRQLRDAMRTILNSLNKGDHFSIVQFNTVVQVLDWSQEIGHWRDYNRHSTDRTITLEATPENIARAQIIISTLEAHGVTNMAEALDVAVDIAHEKTDTNGNAENAVATENNKLESIIIFLTDGQPTAGETDTNVIINRVNAKNVGQNKASLFSLAFGSDPDRNFLRKLSLSNSGLMRHIYMAGDAALQLQDFYRTVASPLLADVQFKYPKEQIKEGSLTNDKFPTYYAGSETVVAGRVADDAVELSPRLIAICWAPDLSGRRPYEETPKVPVVHRDSYFPLERIWAYLTIKQLLDQKDSLLENNENKGKALDLEKSALDIALQYEFVTPLTSLVVVKPNDTRAVEVKPADEDNQFISHLDKNKSVYSGTSFDDDDSDFRMQMPSSRIVGGSVFRSSSYPDQSFRSRDPTTTILSGVSYDAGNDNSWSLNSRILGGPPPFVPYSNPGRSFITYNRNPIDPPTRILSGFRSPYYDDTISLRSSDDSDPDGLSYHMLSGPPVYQPTIRIMGGRDDYFSGRPVSFDPWTTMHFYPPTTPEPPTTTPEPSTTTAVPSTTTAEPSTTTAQTSTMAAEPSTTTAEPSTTTAHTSTMAAEPSTTTAEPSTTTAEPSTTTAEPSTTPAEPSTTTTESFTKSAMINATEDTLEPYSLKEFAWTLSLLDAANDALTLHVNGTKINLKLTKDIFTAPADGAACAATDGGAARCRYLPRCGAARALSAERYQTAYCVLEDGYAGVCCPIPKEHAQYSIKA